MNIWGLMLRVKRRTIYLVIFFFIVLLGLGFVLFRNNNQQSIRPERGAITEAVYGLGKVKSHKRFDVIVGVLSTVTKLYVDEGTSVDAKAPLILFEGNNIVRAPFKGTVTKIRFRDGEVALPQAPVLRMEDLKDLYIELSLEQEAAIKIRPGQVAKVSFEAMRHQQVTGKVISIFSRDDEFISVIEVPDLSDNVLPGMTADVSIETGHINDAILIPVTAVADGMVTVRRNGRWKKEKVDLGHVDGMRIEVLKGLKPEDEIRVERR